MMERKGYLMRMMEDGLHCETALDIYVDIYLIQVDNKKRGPRTDSSSLISNQRYDPRGNFKADRRCEERYMHAIIS